MESFASMFNSNRRLFDINTSSFTYLSLREIFEAANGVHKVYRLSGLFISGSSKFGDSSVAILADDSMCTYLPSHLTATVKRILADEQAIQAIKDGKVGISVYKYEYDKNNTYYYSIKFVDI